MQPLELTLLRVEQDRADFAGWMWLDCFSDLAGGAAQRQGVRPLPILFAHEY
ncbi:MAG: hypothetical protein MUD01_02295 [Chloroflexaceae bacterium]|nr:hypothetical protein [Chloroflexaceae bacterium]